MLPADTKRALLELFSSLDPAFLAETHSRVGGGAALSLLLGDYRGTSDLDILCFTEPGYRKIRETVSSSSLGHVFKKTPSLAREVRIDRYAVRAFVHQPPPARPLKFEIVREDGCCDPCANIQLLHGVPVLSRLEFFATKLLANASRATDRAFMNRDMWDLVVMITNWGDPPLWSWEAARRIVGADVNKGWHLALDTLLASSQWRTESLNALDMDVAWSDILLAMVSHLRALPDISERLLQPTTTTKPQP